MRELYLHTVLFLFSNVQHSWLPVSLHSVRITENFDSVQIKLYLN